MTQPPALAHAQKWYDAGFAETQKAGSLWKQFRARLFDAGYYFGKAREAAKHGDWQLFLDCQERKMKRRTIDFYIALSVAAMEWAKADKPELKGDALLDHARDVMMESPKPLVALLRDLRELRPFGEYDAIKYRLKRIGDGSEQMELNFEKVFSTFDALEHDFIFTLPEGKSEMDALRELKEKCDRVSAKLGAQLDRTKTTDI